MQTDVMVKKQHVKDIAQSFIKKSKVLAHRMWANLTQSDYDYTRTRTVMGCCGYLPPLLCRRRPANQHND